MNLKQMLNGGNQEQLLTAKDYRIASQMRVHAGKMLVGLTPLVALGAVTNLPVMMIPAFYIPTALLIPQLNYFLLKSVPKTGKQPFLARLNKGLFSNILGIGLIIAGVAIYDTFFNHPTHYQRNHGFSGMEFHFQASHGWTLIVAGLAMTGICAWLSFTLMKGRRTQSMQRIAQHLAAQEAENA